MTIELAEKGKKWYDVLKAELVKVQSGLESGTRKFGESDFGSDQDGAAVLAKVMKGMANAVIEIDSAKEALASYAEKERDREAAAKQTTIEQAIAGGKKKGEAEKGEEKKEGKK